MADIYLDSVTGSDSDDGSTRALAVATLQDAVTKAGNDGRVFADDGHAETSASGTVITLEELANPVTIVSVDFAGTADPNPPVEADVSPGAKLTTTGNSSITINNSGYIRGFTFDMAVGAVSGAPILSINPKIGNQQYYEDCKFQIGPRSNSFLRMFISDGTSQTVTWKSCMVKFGHADQDIVLDQGAFFLWEGGGEETGSTDVDKLFALGSESSAHLSLIGVDLSGMKSTFDLLTGGAANNSTYFFFRNCKMPSSWTGSLFDTAPTRPGARGLMVNCDDGDTNYRLWLEDWLGVVRDETTVYRSGGASDGTTSISHKYTTTAAASFLTPFRGHAIESEANFDDIGSGLTATLHYMHDGANALKTKEIWGRVEYLGTSGFPLSLFADDAPVNVLSADANQSTSTADWDDGVTGWVADTVTAVGDFIRPTTPDGTVMICTEIAGDFKTHATTEPTWPAEGSTVVDDQVTWRKMRREKIDVAFTPQEKGPFLITPMLGGASITTLFLDPLPIVV